MYNYESDTNITREKIRPRQLEKLTRFLYINRAHNNDCYYTSYL